MCLLSSSHLRTETFKYSISFITVGKEAVRLADHSVRIMWGPEKGRTDIEKGVEVEDVPTRVRDDSDVSPAVCKKLEASDQFTCILSCV